MNLKLRDEMDFLTEYQQEPLTAAGEEEKPKLSTIADRVNRLPKGVLPLWASRLVAFIDVQAKARWYKVAAFADDSARTTTGWTAVSAAWPPPRSGAADWEKTALLCHAHPQMPQLRPPAYHL